MKIRKTQTLVHYPEHRGTESSIRYPAFVEPKRDGEYCVAHINGDKTYLINKYGTQRYDCPITYVLQTFAKQENIQSAILLGELCFMDGMKGQLYDLNSNKTNELTLKFWAFDISMLNGSGLTHEDILTRKEILLNKFGHLNSNVFRINQVNMVNDKDELAFWRASWKTDGMEGVVVKNLDSTLVFGPCGWVKIKDKDQTVYKISMIDPVKERIEVTVTSVDSLGRKHVKPCGVKVMHADKKNLKIGDDVIIEHQGVLTLGGLRHPVYIGRA